MVHRKWAVRYVAIAAVLALALTGAALAGVVAHTASAKAARVTVIEKSYSLTLKHTLAPGLTTFVVVNRASIGHSLEISGPGLKAKRITGLVAPGHTRLLTVMLKAGTYRIWCPVPGHAALGMKANIAVGSATASSSAAGQATTTSSGKSGGWG
jgi:uncharacterized cupredoxin-like copper-binding protein